MATIPMYPLAQSHRPGVPAFPLAGHHSSNDILASLERGLQVLCARIAGSGAHSAVAQGGAAQGAPAQRGTSAQVTRFHPYRRRGLQLLDVTNAVAIRAKNLSVFTDVQLKRISKGNGNKAMADQLLVQGHARPVEDRVKGCWGTGYSRSEKPSLIESSIPFDPCSRRTHSGRQAG
jgi:hypothetical protein